MDLPSIQTEHSYLRVLNYDLDTECIRDVIKKLYKNPEIRVYGKICHQHRSVGFFSDTSEGYKYSGRLMKSQSLTPSLKTLLEDINRTFGLRFNGILVNRYESGMDYISAHSDDEKGIQVNDVVTISYGAVRTFRIRDKVGGKIVADIPTESGKIIHMGGEFQREFTHEIPIQKRIQGIRYSFTFRYHVV